MGGGKIFTYKKKMIRKKKMKNKIWQLLLMFYMLQNEKICPAYISKHNSICKKTSYSINDSKRRRMALCNAVKNFLHYQALLRRINHEMFIPLNFYCLKCFHFFATENKLEWHKKYVKKKICVILLCLLKILKFQSLIKTKNLMKHHLLFMQILSV